MPRRDHWQYQSFAGPLFAPEVEPLEWAPQLSEQPRQRSRIPELPACHLGANPQDFPLPEVVMPDKWYAMLQPNPRRARWVPPSGLPPIQASPPPADTILASWGVFSQPRPERRRPGQLQPTLFLPPHAPNDVVTADRWLAVLQPNPRRLPPRQTGWSDGVLEPTLMVLPPGMAWERRTEQPRRPKPWMRAIQEFVEPGNFPNEVITLDRFLPPPVPNPSRVRPRQSGLWVGVLEPTLHVAVRHLGWFQPASTRPRARTPINPQPGVLELNPADYGYPYDGWNPPQAPRPAKRRGLHPEGGWVGVVEASLIEPPPGVSWWVQATERLRRLPPVVPGRLGEWQGVLEPTLFTEPPEVSWYQPLSTPKHNPAPDWLVSLLGGYFAGPHDFLTVHFLYDEDAAAFWWRMPDPGNEWRSPG